MFSRDNLQIDAVSEAERIAMTLREQVGVLRRRGLVLGLSGGIDSSVSCALAVKAVGKERVFGIIMPERDSSDDAFRLGRLVADTFGVPSSVENIGPALNALGCYERQAEVVRGVAPNFGHGWKFKLALPSILESDRLNITRLVVEAPDGTVTTYRLSAPGYNQIVAATNYKQRLRKVTEYYHADRLGYCVIGTPNRLEYDQGFFVKQGDGAADVKPIAHLYKTQVYALASHLGVPDEICKRPPTTDTFSMAQTQEEFYFALPYDRMDLCLYGHNHQVSADHVAPVVGLTAEQVKRVYKDIEAKRRSTKYLHARPLLIESVSEV